MAAASQKESSATTTVATPAAAASKPVPMSTFYSASAKGGGKAVSVIRSPGVHDVLSGRGGSVNSHPGNCQFREWVHERKTDYNLAHSKKDKTVICEAVISKVRAVGGRFLQRQPNNSSFWVELDEDRIMAKTSQALREGAPRIREQHRDELPLQRTNKKRKSRKPSYLVDDFDVEDADDENSVDDNTTAPTAKRVRVEYKGQTLLPEEATPPLVAQPPPHHLQARLDEEVDSVLMPAPEPLPLSFALPPKRETSNLTRTHSLALSDMSLTHGDLADFVDPFQDESELLGRTTLPNSVKSIGSNNSSSSAPFCFSPRSSTSLSTLPPRLGITRDWSNNSYSSSSDLAGLGALLREVNSNSNNQANKKSSTQNVNISHSTTVHSSDAKSIREQINEVRFNNISSNNGSFRYADAGNGDTSLTNHEEDDNSVVGLPLSEDWYVDWTPFPQDEEDSMSLNQQIFQRPVSP